MLQFQFFLVNWFAGTLFMFHFANLISGCRRHLRPGLLWFVHDMYDESEADPVQNMLARPLSVTLPKIMTSFVIYSSVALVMFLPLYAAVLAGFVRFALEPEWNVAYWMAYLVVLRAFKYVDLGVWYSRFLSSCLHLAARWTSTRSVMFGGWWDGDGQELDDPSKCIQNVEMVADQRVVECPSDRASFMLVLAQDKFVDVEGIKELFGVDEPVLRRRLEYDVSLLPPKTDVTDTSAAAAEPIAQFHIQRDRSLIEYPILSAMKSWRDPLRICMGYREFLDLVGIRYNSADVGMYRNRMYNQLFEYDKRPSPPSLDIILHSPFGHNIKLSATIVYKPAGLHARVLLFLALFLSMLSMAHYVAAFGALAVGRKVVSAVAASFAARYRPNDFGALILGMSCFVFVFVFTIRPVVLAKKYINERYRSRLLVSGMVTKTLTKSNWRNLPRHNAVLVLNSLIVARGLTLSAYDAEKAVLIFNKHFVRSKSLKHDIRRDCNVGRFWFIPTYFTFTFKELITRFLMCLAFPIVSIVRYTYIIVVAGFVIPLMFGTIANAVSLSVGGIIVYSARYLLQMLSSLATVQKFLALNFPSPSASPKRRDFVLQATRDWSPVENIVAGIMNFITVSMHLHRLRMYSPLRGLLRPLYDDIYTPLIDMRWSAVSVSAINSTVLKLAALGVWVSGFPLALWFACKQVKAELGEWPVARSYGDDDLWQICNLVAVPLTIFVMNYRIISRDMKSAVRYLLDKIRDTECLVEREVADHQLHLNSPTEE